MDELYAEARRLADKHGVPFATDWFELASKYFRELRPTATASERAIVMHTAARAVAYRLETNR